MGKIKSKFFDNKTQQEIENELYHRYDDELQYKEWLESDDYINFVNDQLEYAKPIFSSDDIKDALDWAKSAINTEPTEVGKDVYDILFIEKVNEHLNKIRNDRF